MLRVFGGVVMSWREVSGSGFFSRRELSGRELPGGTVREEIYRSPAAQGSLQLAHDGTSIRTTVVEIEFLLKNI